MCQCMFKRGFHISKCFSSCQACCNVIIDYLGVCSTSHPPQKPWPLAAAAPHTTPKTLPDPSDMPTVASDVAVPRDLAVFTATTIEMEVQVGASPQLCTRRRAPPLVWGALELPPPRMHRIGSIWDGGGGGGQGIACNNERKADMQLKNILQLLLIGLRRP